MAPKKVMEKSDGKRKRVLLSIETKQEIIEEYDPRPNPEFKASHGWFHKWHGEAASANQKSADEFVQKFKEFVDEEGYVPQQVFNCDETGLFWKKMPRRTYITIEEKKLPGHKPMKDPLTLALCANASGDCKVKPLLVYHSENPRAFKVHKIMKDYLPVFWRANPRAWVTRLFFVEWVNVVFGPTVKHYLKENNLPLKCLLILDNAPAHYLPALEEGILQEFSFIKFLFLPPNITSILQPMEQQVIWNFKILYTKYLFKRCFNITEDTQLTLRQYWKQHFDIVVCLKIIDLAWQKMSRHNLNSAWRKLWPDAVSTRGFETVGDIDCEVSEIVSLGKSMGLEVDHKDIHELIEEHNEELSPEEVKELKEMLLMAWQEEWNRDQEEEEAEAPISTSEIKDILQKFHSVVEFIEKEHPEKVFTSRTIAHFDDVCLSHFRRIVKRQQKQSFSHRFGMKYQGESRAESEPKPKKAKGVNDSS